MSFNYFVIYTIIFFFSMFTGFIVFEFGLFGLEVIISVIIDCVLWKHISQRAQGLVCSRKQKDFFDQLINYESTASTTIEAYNNSLHNLDFRAFNKLGRTK